MVARTQRAWRGLLVAGMLLSTVVRPAFGVTPVADEDVLSGGAEAGADANSANGTPRWGVPPVDFWGDLQYDFLKLRGDGQATTLEHLLTARVNAATFVYQPWFAVVTGGVGITTGYLTGDVDAGRTNFVTGNARIDMFPRSRFPFEAHAEIADGRVDSGAPNYGDYQTTRFGFSQRYRPPEGQASASFAYDHVEQSGFVYGTDVQDTFFADFETAWPDQRLFVNATGDLRRRPLTNESSDYETLVARHSYWPTPEWSVESLANYGRNRVDVGGLTGDANAVQLSSVALWRPENRPWTVSASARAFGIRSSGTGGGSQGGQATVGATYTFTPLLRLTSNLTAGATGTDFGTNTFHAESANLTYQSDAIPMAGFDFDWFGSVAATNAGDARGSETFGGGSLGYSLRRTFALPDGSSLTGNFTQSLTGLVGSASDRADDREASGPAAQLANTLSLTWSKSTDQAYAYARVSASDARQVYGEQQPVAQLVNLQFSGTWNITRYSSLVGDLTLQHSRQDPGFLQRGSAGVIVGAVGRTTSTSASANLTYRHERVFGAPRLRFTSQLALIDSNYAQQYALASYADQQARTWINRLDYSIGLLTASLSLQFAEVQGQSRSLVQFRLVRNFGGRAF